MSFYAYNCRYIIGIPPSFIYEVKTCHDHSYYDGGGFIKGEIERICSLGPRLSPLLELMRTYDLWTPRNEKSGREPGLFYHVSDVEGREKVLGRENLIARGRPNAQTDCCPRVCPVARYSPVYSHVHSTSVPQSHFHYLQLLAPWPGGVYL